MNRDYYAGLPGKRMGAGAIFFNEKGELLILKPIYKDRWTVPGGTVENEESPMQACLREIREETGLNVKEVKFLSVEYMCARSDKMEFLQFLFYGGVLTSDQIRKINLPPDEIGGYKFVRVEGIAQFLSTHLRRRILLSLDALKNNTPLYIENFEQ